MVDNQDAQLVRLSKELRTCLIGDVVSKFPPRSDDLRRALARQCLALGNCKFVLSKINERHFLLMPFGASLKPLVRKDTEVGDYFVYWCLYSPFDGGLPERPPELVIAKIHIRGISLHLRTWDVVVEALREFAVAKCYKNLGLPRGDATFVIAKVELRLGKKVP